MSAVSSKQKQKLASGPEMKSSRTSPPIQIEVPDRNEKFQGNSFQIGSMDTRS